MPRLRLSTMIVAERARAPETQTSGIVYASVISRNRMKSLRTNKPHCVRLLGLFAATAAAASVRERCRRIVDRAAVAARYAALVLVAPLVVEAAAIVRTSSAVRRREFLKNPTVPERPACFSGNVGPRYRAVSLTTISQFSLMMPSLLASSYGQFSSDRPKAGSPRRFLAPGVVGSGAPPASVSSFDDRAVQPEIEHHRVGAHDRGVDGRLEATVPHLRQVLQHWLPPAPYDGGSGRLKSASFDSLLNAVSSRFTRWLTRTDVHAPLDLGGVFRLELHVADR